jgi:hypothetical protein
MPPPFNLIKKRWLHSCSAAYLPSCSLSPHLYTNYKIITYVLRCSFCSYDTFLARSHKRRKSPIRFAISIRSSDYLSVCLSLSVSLSACISAGPAGRIFVKSDTENFRESREAPNLVKVGQQCRPRYMKTQVRSFHSLQKMEAKPSDLGAGLFKEPRETRLLALSCLCVNLYSHGSHCVDFRKIRYRRLTWTSDEIPKISLKPDNNAGHFTWRPTCVSWCWQHNAENARVCFRDNALNSYYIVDGNICTSTIQK